MKKSKKITINVDLSSVPAREKLVYFDALPAGGVFEVINAVAGKEKSRPDYRPGMSRFIRMSVLPTGEEKPVHTGLMDDQFKGLFDPKLSYADGATLIKPGTRFRTSDQGATLIS